MSADSPLGSVRFHPGFWRKQKPLARLAGTSLIGAGLMGTVMGTGLAVGLAGCSPPAAPPAQTRQVASPGSSAPAPAQAPAQVPAQTAIADAEALVRLGPRVAGSAAAEQASRYLEAGFREAGYQTEVRRFTYEKFVDRGSSLTVNGNRLTGRALNGSIPGDLTARLVAVPGAGRPQDFAQTDVRGAIAVVRRGEIRFSEKANNAAAAGAVGLVIVNREANNFSGTLGSRAAIPVLSLGGSEAEALAGAGSSPATLSVNGSTETITGRNVVAYLAGVRQPDVLLGAHYDSVAESPGANDNASGTAVLLELARQMADQPMARRVWFVAFNGEEDGLHGSRAFVAEAQPQFLRQLRAMLNFDMVGVNAKLNISGSETLTSLVKSVDQSITPERTAGGSDHVAFAAADVPVLFFTRGLDPNYHSPRDREVSAELLNQTAQLALEILDRLLAS